MNDRYIVILGLVDNLSYDYLLLVGWMVNSCSYGSFAEIFPGVDFVSGIRNVISVSGEELLNGMLFLIMIVLLILITVREGFGLRNLCNPVISSLLCVSAQLFPFKLSISEELYASTIILYFKGRYYYFHLA